MALVQLQPTPSDSNPERVAFLDLGFRPFFALAGVAAVGLMLVWLGALLGGWKISAYYGEVGWHAHEMLFGYTVAVIAGFLLTAVRNWTGLPTPSGRWLGLLAGVWLLSRLLGTLALGMPGAVLAGVDLAFLPCLMVALARPLIAAGKWRNLVFLLVLGMLTLANLLVHLEALGITQDTAATGYRLALNLILLLIAILGGRVIPFFTRNPLPGMQLRTWKPIEIGAIGGLLLVVVLELWGKAGHWLSVVLVVVALCHAVRLAGWQDRRLWSRPIIWVLHVGYLCLVAGLLLKALAQWGWVPASVAVHAFTAGTIGMMTLGMMARVALGHTGRSLVLARITVLGIILLTLAVVVRVPLIWWWPDAYSQWILIAGCLWIFAFVAFCAAYLPILWRPRVDGAPG